MTEEQFWILLEKHIIEADYHLYDELCLVFADYCEENGIPAYRALRFLPGNGNEGRASRICPVKTQNYGWFFGTSTKLFGCTLPSFIERECSKNSYDELKDLILDLHNALERVSIYLGR